MGQQGFFKVLSVSVLVLLLVFYGYLRTGFTGIGDSQLLAVLLGGGDAAIRTTIVDFRLLRAVLALCIGAGLALAGAVFQTVSRNELASPSLLGVNAGAGLGVMLLIYFTNLDTALPIWALPLAAIIGAIVAAMAIYRLAYRKGRILSPHILVLTGISLAAGIHALQMLLIVQLDPNKFHTVNTWVIGSIAGNSWSHVLFLGPLVILLGLVLLARYMDLNMLSLADETAIGLGLRINQARFVYLMIAVILAASCVAIGGNISFVGLIGPHIARRLVGADHARSLPITALMGGLLVLIADWFGRTVIAPDEILLGIVVAMMGAPYFLYILIKTKS